MKLTILVPFLNEEASLRKFKERAEELRSHFEEVQVDFVFIDDGSTDQSVDVLSVSKIKNSKIVQLSRNYGSHYALMAGVLESDSDFITFMSSDGQEPLELYPSLLKKARAENLNIVFGLREKRAAGVRESFFSSVYNSLVRRYAFSGFPEGGVDVFLISKKVAQTLKQMPEKNTSLYGLLFTIGFNKGYVPYQQIPRKEGRSKWTLTKKIKLFSDTFVSFTVLPLRMISLVGVFFSLLGFFYGIFVVVRFFQGKIALMGFPTLVSLMTFGFGLVFLMIGVLSEYLWRIFDQVRPRPVFVVQNTIEFNSNGEVTNNRA